MPALVCTQSSECGHDIMLMGPHEGWEKELEGGSVCSVCMSKHKVGDKLAAEDDGEQAGFRSEGCRGEWS